jgi:hypothetical protein
MMKNITISITKVDVDEMMREFKVLNVDIFTSYLKEVWRVIIKVTQFRT